jgi:hypothetical protein
MHEIGSVGGKRVHAPRFRVAIINIPAQAPSGFPQLLALA